MQNAANVALSRMMAQQTALDVTAGNLANAGTPGFKAERMLFADWLDRQRHVAAPRGGQVVAYAQDRATYRQQAAGAITHTANPLDLAIGGAGYFTVQTAQGPMLTRAGHFSLQPTGTVGDAEGHALLDAGGQPIRLSPADTRIQIAGDGTLSSENGVLGKIGVVTPADANRMQAQGDRLLKADSATAPTAQPHLIQGGVEESNVQPITETTLMMDTLREYQFASEFVQSEGDRLQNAIDKLTRPA